MSRVVWEVRATGPAHTHQPVTAAVTAALDQLRYGDTPIPGLQPHERAAWVWAVHDAAVVDVATSPLGCSLLLEVDTIDAYGPHVPDALTPGLNGAVLAAVLAVPGVTAADHSDRILRPTEETR